MRRASSSAIATLLAVDPSESVPLYRQLYDRVRGAILAGRFHAGEQLPSTRLLASDLGLSRNTVVGAFEQLIAEGYLQGATGSGTYVARELPEEALHAPRPSAPAARPERRGPRLSTRGRALAQSVSPALLRSSEPRPFRSGIPALEQFPYEIWTRLVTRCWRRHPHALLPYGDTAGYPPLREAIARYLGVARAVECSPEQVIIISGAQQALHLAAMLLLDPGDEVWVENPGYPGARSALASTGARLVPVPLDEAGLDLDAAGPRGASPRMVYVTPSHQFPTGVTMTLGRRLELLRRTEKSRAWILEDDYDSEYRYASRPVGALQGLDRSGRVIYFGTFSKVLFPALRLAYMVVPPALTASFTAAKAVTDRHSPTVEQAVLAEFISEGHFTRHIRRMRALYLERLEAVLDAFNRELKGAVDVHRPEAGMHIIGWLQKGVSGPEVSRRAAAAEVDASPISSFYVHRPPRDGLMLGYTGYSQAALREATRRLARVFEHVTAAAAD
jgi:GntR family transcriptional regulator / MocR family aminotransferase